MALLLDAADQETDLVEGAGAQDLPDIVQAGGVELNRIDFAHGFAFVLLVKGYGPTVQLTVPISMIVVPPSGENSTFAEPVAVAVLGLF